MRVSDTGGGEREVPGRQRLNDPQLRRTRDLTFRELRRQGYSVAEIARLYRITERQVYKRLAEMAGAARPAPPAPEIRA
jgi:DNA invertase Pin-like site-specific DNA recombinase